MVCGCMSMVLARVELFLFLARKRNNKKHADQIKVFATDIPLSVRAAEISAEGKSIYAYDPKGKAAEAYRELTKEVLRIGQQREKAKSDIVR